jgi:uncharacterized protein (TIGR00255 family)
MIRSMTGFGRGESQFDGYRFLVEIKSVNHRFLNTSLRLPREFGHLESALAAQCATRCERGHLSVKLDVEPIEGGQGRGPRLNREVLDRFLQLADGLEALPGVTGRLPVDALLTLPGVLEWEPVPIRLADDEFLAGAGEALGSALDEVVATRGIEGRALETDLRERLDALDQCGVRLAELAPAREARERERLRAKLAELMPADDPALEQRVAQEVVLHADRVDISEELTRMRAHLDHFRSELDASGAVGRKLTFLLQELHREANTIGSKANDPAMQRIAIEIKSELEKMREQAENVE